MSCHEAVACDRRLMVVGGCSDPRNRHRIAVGQATGVNVGYRASILGRPMSATAALLTVTGKINHRPCLTAPEFLASWRKAGSGEIQSQLSTFRRVSCGSGERRVCVFGPRSPLWSVHA